MKINLDFDLGQTVYFKNDDAQDKYIVTGITIRPFGFVYILAGVGSEVYAYAIELSDTKTIF